jgi:hypothetical protein
LQTFARDTTLDREIDLHRPDWWHALIATVNANVWRNLADCAQHGHYAFAINVDAVYFVSANPDPIAGAPRGLKLGTKPGQYKHEGSTPLARAVEVLAQPARSHLRTLGRLIEKH